MVQKHSGAIQAKRGLESITFQSVCSVLFPLCPFTLLHLLIFYNVENKSVCVSIYYLTGTVSVIYLVTLLRIVYVCVSWNLEIELKLKKKVGISL